MLSPRVRRVFHLALRRHDRIDADIDDEIRLHIEMRVEQLVQRGWTRAEAEGEARRRFGASWEDDVRRVRASGHQREEQLAMRERIEAIWQDVRYALRGFRREPRFAALAVLTLALGIGATTAIFSLVNRAVLNPLPYPHPERIAYLGWRWSGMGGAMGALAPRQFVFWREQSRAFEGVATHRGFEGVLDGPESGVDVLGMRVSDDFFHVLGARPELGRTFSPEEMALDGPSVVILGHALWETRYGSDPRILGRVVRISGQPHVVVGVMPASFRVAGASEWTQVLMPLRLDAAQLADNGHNYEVVARLRPGVSFAQAQAEMPALFDRYRAAHAAALRPEDRGAVVMRYQDIYTGELATMLWIMLAATAFVLLLAAANVANLMLTRAVGRQREIAVRTALGAGRGRIVRQLVTEGLVLGGLAAAVGSILTFWGLRIFLALGPQLLPYDADPTRDVRVLLFVAGLALAVGATLGVASALAATRMDLSRALAEGGRTGSAAPRQRRLRDMLIALESGLAMVLLAGAGLLIASFVRLRSEDPGFAREGVLTARVAKVPPGYDSAAVVSRFEDQLLARIRATPGVLAAAGVSALPLVRGWNLPMTVDGRPDATEGAVEWKSVSADYFKTLGIPLVQGRDVTANDGAGAALVAIVTQSLADHYWPGERVIGRRIWVGRFRGEATAPGGDELPREIVGVVADSKQIGLDRKARRTIFVPQAQVPPRFVSVPAFVVRAGRTTDAATAVREAIRAVDARMGAPDFLAMNDIVARSLGPRRFTMLLMTTFAVLALVLTSVGIYAVVSYSVAARLREIGVRIALGARPGAAVRLMIVQGMKPVLIGLTLGVAAALATTRVMQSLLYGVGPRDPQALGAVAALLAVVALLASWLPARKASRVDPIVALRGD